MACAAAAPLSARWHVSRSRGTLCKPGRSEAGGGTHRRCARHQASCCDALTSLREEAENEQGEPKVLPVTPLLRLAHYRLDAIERPVDRRRVGRHREKARFVLRRRTDAGSRSKKGYGEKPGVFCWFS